MKLPYLILKVLIFSLILCICTRAQAEDQRSDRLKALERFSKALEKEKNLSQELKDSLKDLVTELAEAPAPEPTPAALAKDESTATVLGKVAAEVKKTKVTADFRLRHETDWRDSDNAHDRNRERARFRLGAEYEVDPQLTVEARVVTGNTDDPQSPHQTLGDVNDKWSFNLDRANLKYKPSWLPGSLLTAGKFYHPFYRNPVYNELIWDSDVQPEGAVASYTLNSDGVISKANLTAGEYLILQQDQDDEITQFVTQASVEARLSKTLSSTLAVGWYKYSNLTADDATLVVADNAGNAVVDLDGDDVPDKFVSDFSILNPIWSISYKDLPMLLSLGAEYLYNFDAETDEDTGYSVGAALGDNTKRGDWKIYYNWLVVEQDAVFTPFSHDDFILNSNYRTHLIGAKYMLLDKLELHIWSSITSPDKGEDADEARGRVDLNVSL